MTIIRQRESYDDQWLDRLDEIATGNDEPSPGDGELLQLAAQLASTLAPLRELDAPALAHRQRLATRLRMQYDLASSSRAPRLWKKWLFRPLVAAAAILLFILLGPGLIFELNLPAGSAGAHPHPPAGNAQNWQAGNLPFDTSFTIVPPTAIPRGLTLLLPLSLPSNAYLVSIDTGDSNGGTPTNGYLIYTPYVHIYESPSQLLPTRAYTSSTYTFIKIGSVNALLLRTGDGENRIEWYQAGLLCDMVSKAPVAVMVSTIQSLQPVTY